MAERPQRRSIRLSEYNYNQPGGYFVTIVTAGRVARFGSIVDGEMALNAAGQMVLREWHALPARFAGWTVDAFVVMPNHVHGILFLEAGEGPPYSTIETDQVQARWPLHVLSGSLGAVVRGFKSATTLRYHYLHGAAHSPLWQRNYYEHIVRSPRDLESIRAYVIGNPAAWEGDPDNPERPKS